MENFCKLICGAAVALFGVIVVADLMRTQNEEACEMYPYHNKIKQRIHNGELVGFEFVEDWPKIGSCLLLRFNTMPAMRPIRPHRYDEYMPILTAWAHEKFGAVCTEEKTARKILSDLAPGETFKVGERELVVLEHNDGETAVICKGLLYQNMEFGENNNFAESKVLDACEKFADELKGIVGEENLVEHAVDLTSDDGLDDYGIIEQCRVSLLTTNQYRRWVEILDMHKTEGWWWLATAHSTATHENESWVKCVSPRGRLFIDLCNFDDFGVRPFCIFKSSIFVS